MNRKNFAWAAAAVLALTGVAAACGGNDDDNTVIGAPSRAPSAAEQNAADLATAPEAAASGGAQVGVNSVESAVPNVGNQEALNEVTDQVLYGAATAAEQNAADLATAPDPSVGDAIAPDAQYHGDLHRNVEQPSNGGSTAHPADLPPQG
jgi:hypothetical protein